MAVSFRHGSNGSYKSAYAVWFEIVPALRAGRLVITNVEGLKSLQGIEKALGEKFPDSAKLIRLFSRSEEGVHLWQNWFCWAPVGALLIIDECQDLFTADVGFKREKALYKPVEEFLEFLPDGFSELFYSRWLPVPEEAKNNDGEEDDSGRTQYDDSGRLIYPYNFYGAFMRHRKYQWDIILLTPDWTSIPNWLRGCAQSAFSHSSKDTFFRKRRPRIFYHSPQVSKSQPTTKGDYANCTTAKIPLDVFALYKSTGTGDFNESKADITVLKSPKFILSIVVAVIALIYCGVSFYEILSRPDSDTVQEINSNPQDEVSGDSVAPGDDGVRVPENKTSNSYSGGVAAVRGNGENSVPSGDVGDGVTNPFHVAFPIFDDADSFYITSWQTEYVNGYGVVVFGIRVDKGADSYYLRSDVLNRYNYRFVQIDDCLVSVVHGNSKHLLTCPPYRDDGVSDDSQSIASAEPKIDKSIDLFGL